MIEPNDDVLHLGDFAGRQSAVLVAYLKALNSRKHPVVGNNDDAVAIDCNGWRIIQQYAELVINGVRLGCATILFGLGGTWTGAR